MKLNFNNILLSYEKGGFCLHVILGKVSKSPSLDKFFFFYFLRNDT